MDKKARIVICGALPPPYIGPSIATGIIINSSLKEDFELLHLDLSDPRPIRYLGKLDFINFILGFRQIFSLIKILIKEQPDIVYIPISQTLLGLSRDLVFILISKTFKARVILHLRGGYFRQLYEGLPYFLKKIIRQTLSLASAVIVLSSSLRYIFKGLVKENTIFVVQNGLDLFDSFAVEGTLKAKVKNEGLQILFLSNFIENKGFFESLEAARLILDKYAKILKIKFIFAGEYSSKKQQVFLEKYVQDNLPSPGVVFCGPVSGKTKEELMLSSDIFLFPTHYYAEGQPWVLIEAIAAGLPIVTASIGAIKDVACNELNAFVLDKARPQDIAEKLGFLIEDQALRINMSWVSRRVYSDSFTESHFIGGLKYVFTKVLNR